MTVSVEVPKQLPKPPEPKIEVSSIQLEPKKVVPLPPPEPPKPVKKFKALDLVIIADDSPTVSNMTKDALIKNSLAKDIILCTNGADFISSFMSIIKKGISPSMVMLSVSMPRLNGLETALAMRCMEKGGEMQPPIPIIFLTARQTDEKFEQVIFSLKPADYLYKGAEPNQEKFEYMLTNVTERLFPDNYEYIIMKNKSTGIYKCPPHFPQ